MIEEITPPSEVVQPEQLRRLFTEQELQDVLTSDAFQELNPNYSHPLALLPKELTARQVVDIISIVTSAEMFEVYQNRHKIKNLTKKIPEVGDITKIGEGESKICYRLTTPEGKRLVILFGGYGDILRSPKDSKVYRVFEGLWEDKYVYSDLRTYLCMPFTTEVNSSRSMYGILLQEDGGDKRLNVLYPLTQKLTARKILEYTNAYGLKHTSATMGELKHQRHFFE